jgi:hypothetical protein
MSKTNYLGNLWTSFSQVINAIFGGKPCETISSRAYRANNWVKKVINKVFFFQENHCRASFFSDVTDAEWLVSQLPAPKSDEIPEVADTDTPEIRDSAWFWNQPFDDQLKYVESGEWIRNGLSDFFSLQWDDTVPKDTRRRIAKAYAFRYGMPYSDPVNRPKAPQNLGMGDDGHQK